MSKCVLFSSCLLAVFHLKVPQSGNRIRKIANLPFRIYDLQTCFYRIADRCSLRSMWIMKNRSSGRIEFFGKGKMKLSPFHWLGYIRTNVAAWRRLSKFQVKKSGRTCSQYGEERGVTDASSWRLREGRTRKEQDTSTKQAQAAQPQ